MPMDLWPLLSTQASTRASTKRRRRQVSRRKSPRVTSKWMRSWATSASVTLISSSQESMSRQSASRSETATMPRHCRGQATRRVSKGPSRPRHCSWILGGFCGDSVERGHLEHGLHRHGRRRLLPPPLPPTVHDHPTAQLPTCPLYHCPSHLHLCHRKSFADPHVCQHEVCTRRSLVPLSPSPFRPEPSRGGVFACCLPVLSPLGMAVYGCWHTCGRPFSGSRSRSFGLLRLACLPWARHRNFVVVVVVAASLDRRASVLSLSLLSLPSALSCLALALSIALFLSPVCIHAALHCPSTAHSRPAPHARTRSVDITGTLFQPIKRSLARLLSVCSIKV
ncbi:hypothetical protein BC831DRAFT_185982 [Entophlyctis helioformis]|nr:hypothetical protein BC831DRAFT_185982 [Entophlyctis helioformis]